MKNLYMNKAPHTSSCIINKKTIKIKYTPILLTCTFYGNYFYLLYIHSSIKLLHYCFYLYDK